MFKVKFVVLTKVNKNNSSVRIVGNLPTLGNWNPFNGLQLEQYDEGQWQSIKHIQIPNGQQFQFKIVRILNNNTVEWEELPNNSNRKFKPKFHTKLMLTWSSHIGKALNEAKSSLKLKGLPGVMVKGHNEPAMLKRKPQKNKKNVLYDSDSSDQNQNDSFCMGRKKSSDIRESINSGDIQEIYYETTELEIAYQNYKQIQVNLVFSHSKQNNEFLEKIQEQLQELYQLQNFKFKWLSICNSQNQSSQITRKINFKKLQLHEGQGKIRIQSYAVNNFQKNHFIFLDLESALNSDVQNASACLYLPSEQFEKGTKFLNQLQKFRFICFDDPQTNKMLLKLFEQKKQKQEEQNQKFHEQKLEQLSRKVPRKSKSDKQIQYLSLQKIIQQLQFCRQSQTPVNTVAHSFSKQQALSNILAANQILFIDSDIMKTDKKFFQKLINSNLQKRLIIIIHKVGVPQWIHNFDSHKNVCVILDNFSKLYLLGRIHDPTKKHKNSIHFIEMRIKLFEKQCGGSWVHDQNCFIYNFKENTPPERAANLKAQLQNLLKDNKYFKVSTKQHKLKISWNLCYPVRLLRTLIRLKFIEQGRIGNFYTVSQNENFTQLKQQIRLLINTNTLYMQNGKETKIYDYGFGKNSNAKYIIKSQGVQLDKQSSSTSQSLGEKQIKIDKKQKKK